MLTEQERKESHEWCLARKERLEKELKNLKQEIANTEAALLGVEWDLKVFSPKG